MLLLIDNYDSFTYNLFQYFSELGQQVVVVRNDKTSLEEIEKMKPDRIVISPGPATPLQAGISNDIIRHFGSRLPILGVCLGHQCIGYTYGGVVVQAKQIMHGKSSIIHHNGKGVFAGITNPFSAIRYHSLVVRREDLPDCLEVTAWTEDGTIMGMRHKQHQVEGVQFHPESFMSQNGKEILRNFLANERQQRIREAIQTVASSKSLTVDQAAGVMEEIMSGAATPAQFGAFVTALRLKGESVEEITGLARTMRTRAVPVIVDGDIVDNCGTGGDGAQTFNISTVASFVAAGAGLKVAKHGNRAMSSRSGSADVLETLGVKIDLNAAGVKKCIETVGIGFLFAPTFHPAMRFAAGPRREIGIRTVFNILGPLTNPARATAQVIGVPEVWLVEKIAAVLKGLGCRHALVVHGADGLDEISNTGPTIVCELKDGRLKSYEIMPEELGLPLAKPADLKGGDTAANANIMLSVLSGALGPQRDVVVMNAAGVLLVGDKVDTLREGVTLAKRVIDNGSALKKLNQLIELTRQLGQ